MSQFTVNLLQNTNMAARRSLSEVGGGLGRDLTLRKGKFLASATPTSMQGLGPCMGLELRTLTSKYAAHSAPELENAELVEGQIMKILSRLREGIKHSYDDVIAVIYGGIHYDPLIPGSGKSIELIDRTYNALMKENIPTAVIAEQKSDGLSTRLNSYIANNKTIIWGDLFKKLGNAKNMSKNELQESLENHFDFVEFVPEIDVKLVESFPWQKNR